MAAAETMRLATNLLLCMIPTGRMLLLNQPALDKTTWGKKSKT